MFIHFFRENRYVSFLLAGLRLYLGWLWLHAGWEKISSGKFDASGFIYEASKKGH